MYKIEKGVEMPREQKKHHNRIYPFREMEIGDSFLIKTTSMTKDEDYQKTRNRAYSAAAQASARLKVRFKVMDAIGGFRIWRVS